MIDLDLIVQAIKDNSVAGMILAILIGVSRVISAVNEGKASKERITQLEEDLSSTKVGMDELEKKLEDMRSKMEEAFNERHDYIAKYNDAKNYAILLELMYKHPDKKQW